jgi:hypothetical protein
MAPNNPSQIKEQPKPNKWAWPGLVLGSILLVTLTYGDALRLPFFFDDLVQIPLAQDRSLAQLWVPEASYPYFRPLGFTIWHLAGKLWGSQSVIFHHGLNLILHIANGLMVAFLGELLRTRQKSPPLTWRGTLATLLFLLYPFSYQAVPWIGSVFHLLVTTLILAALICFWLAHLTSQKQWAWWGFLPAALAPFAHENGLLVIPLALILLVTQRTKPKRTDVITLLAWSLPAILWLSIRLGLNPVADSVGNNLETMGQNVVYLLQGMAYPITSVGGLLRDQLGFNDMLTAAALSLLALGLAFAGQFHRGWKQMTLWPWLWVGLAVLPIIPTLSFGYVISGARLLMLASVGLAWLWTYTAEVLLNRLRWRPRAVVLVLCLLILTQNFIFLRQRMALYNLLGDSVDQAVEGVQAGNAAAKKVAIINLPSWIAYRQTIYALGHEGITFIPGYVPMEAIIAVQTEDPVQVQMLRYDDLIPSLSPYYFDVVGSGLEWPQLIGDGVQLHLTDFTEQALTVHLVGDLAAPLISTPPLATFAEGITLGAAAVTSDPTHLTLDLHWQTDTPIPEGITVFVHGLNQAGELITQADGHAIAGIYPMSLWPTNQAVRDVRYLDQADAVTEIYLGLYNGYTGERMPAYRPDGSRWPDDRVPLYPSP